MSDDSAQDAVTSGQVWEKFCDDLKAAGQQILRAEAPGDPLHRAEGWRYLTRLTRIGLDMFVECSDRDFPTFYKPSHETAKIGADNPDNLYLRAEIDGRHRYRIRGSRGTVAYLGFIAIAGGYEQEDAAMRPVGAVDSHSGLNLGEQGELELIVAADKPATGNWLPISADTVAVLVRQTFLDRSAERPAELVIDRLPDSDADIQPMPQPLTPARIAQGLANTSAFVQGTARVFADWAQQFQQRANTLPPADQAYCQKLGGDPNIFYYHGYFSLADDQALVVEVDSLPRKLEPAAQ